MAFAKSDEQLLDRVFWSNRKGEFISTALSPDFARLEELTQAPDERIRVLSAALVAETLDQLGEYEKAATYSPISFGEEQWLQLRNDVARQSKDRILASARSLLILQSAVCHARLEDLNEKRLAVRLIDNMIELLAKHTEHPLLRSLHVRTLFLFWRGRIQSTLYLFDQADSDFQQALEIADRNLSAKLYFIDSELRQLDLDVQLSGEDKTKKRNDLLERRSSQVAAASYLLATITGFGLSQLEQLRSQLDRSLRYARLAVPLSRVSYDYHRRGFAHLLKGIALRSRGAFDQNEGDYAEARKHLEAAHALFGGNRFRSAEVEIAGRIPVHHLHLARANHQLALLRYNSGAPGSDECKIYLTEALELNEDAAKERDLVSTVYRDPVLDYGIEVVQSLICTGLAHYHLATHKDALDAADRALGILQKRQVPAGLHGWASLAQGMAWAAMMTDNGLEEAERIFHTVIKRDGLRATDRAAAHLHLSEVYAQKNDFYNAVVQCDQADRLIEDSELEHGWIKAFAKRARDRASTTSVPLIQIDILTLLNSPKSRSEGAWKHISDYALSAIRTHLLRVKQEDLEELGIDAVATQLGVTGPTLRAWLSKHDELRRRARKQRGPKKKTRH